jgi:hypothetical protein
VFRVLAAAILLFGVAGGAYVGQERDTGATGAEQAATVTAEVQMLQRMAEVRERTDRGGRSAIGAAESTAGEPVGRGEVVATSPAPEPEPASDPPAGNPPSTSVPASCSEYDGNRATGCALLLEWGFSLDQMSCLDNLWTRESGWNHLAENPSSGAYGIPQSLPGNKMAEYGDDWRTNPVTQIQWGLSYIENRYGTPCSAWSFFQANNWY